MAVGVVTFKVVSRDANTVIYAVTSPDFADLPGEQAFIGTVKVLVGDRTFTFEPGGALANRRVVPPTLFLQFSSEEIHKKIAAEDLGREAMPWMRRIGISLKFMFERNDFPDSYP